MATVVGLTNQQTSTEQRRHGNNANKRRSRRHRHGRTSAEPYRHNKHPDLAV